MAQLGKVVYLSKEEFTTLYTTGTITKGGVTLTYSLNDLYLIPDEGGTGAVASVNGKTGVVVLSAGDINTTGGTTIQANIDRIDGRIDDYAEDNIEGSSTITFDLNETDSKYQIKLDQDVIDDINSKASIASLADVAFSGDYEDLSNTPTIPTVPTNVSAFTNDAGYITTSALSGYATESYVDDAIEGLNIPTKTSDLTNDSGFLYPDSLTGEVDMGIDEFVWNFDESDDAAGLIWKFNDTKKASIIYDQDDKVIWVEDPTHIGTGSTGRVNIIDQYSAGTGITIGNFANHKRPISVNTSVIQTKITSAAPLSASLVVATNTQSVQANLERIDASVEDCIDDIDTLEETVAGKQDTLTAGEGITIENNVISATGGGGSSYSAGEGIIIENDTISTDASQIIYQPAFSQEIEVYNDSQQSLELTVEDSVIYPDDNITINYFPASYEWSMVAYFTITQEDIEAIQHGEPKIVEDEKGNGTFEISYYEWKEQAYAFKFTAIPTITEAVGDFNITINRSTSESIYGYFASNEQLNISINQVYEDLSMKQDASTAYNRDNIVFSSTEPSDPVEGMIWLEPLS